MPGRCAIDAMFALRQVIERYREGQVDLHIAFIDLKKAFDRVPRDELWNCMRERQIPDKYVRLIQDMYKGGITAVRSSVGMTNQFEVKVGVHQGSALSPFLFTIMMDTITEELREKPPWSMLYADEVVLCAESKAGVEEKLELWRRALEDRGLKISRSKTEYMKSTADQNGGEGLLMQGETIRRVEKFRYLGSVIHQSGEMGEEIQSRVQAGWNSWRKVSGVLCDRKLSARLKGKIYKTIVRP